MATTSSETLLEKIRVQFLFDHPFLSVLALSLPVVWRSNPHELFETDGLRLYIDAARAEAYGEAQLKYLYAHILLHVLLKHPFRMAGREAKTWNRSCDIAINLLMNDFERIGERPEEEELQQKFSEMSVEEIYNVLYRESSEGEGEQSEEENREKMDLIESEGDVTAAEAQIDALIVQAMGVAQKQGNIPSSLEEVIREVTRPKIDLETLLHSYMSESFFDKESDFSRPNRRFIHQNIYLPGYSRIKNRLSLTIALDRSMSISKETFSRFLGIIDAIMRIGSDFSIRVLPFDEQVHEELAMEYDAQSEAGELSMSKGNGGTDFAPVAAYMNRLSSLEQEHFLMVLSDGYFSVERMPEVPTLFLVSEKKNMQRFQRYGDVFYFDL